MREDRTLLRSTVCSLDRDYSSSFFGLHQTHSDPRARRATAYTLQLSLIAGFAGGPVPIERGTSPSTTKVL